MTHIDMFCAFSKASRKICGAVKSGIREFSSTGFKVVTG